MPPSAAPLLIRVFCLLLAGAVLCGAGCSPTAPESGGGPTDEAQPVPPPEDVPTWSPREAMPDAAAGWPSLFGPAHDSISAETGLASEWPEAGPPEVWRRDIGEGYSAPVVLGDRVVIHYRTGDEEVVECLDAATGEPRWERRAPTSFRCKYPEYSDGPYATPVIDGRHVYTVGAEGDLRCLDFETGEVAWERNLAREYEAPPGNFAAGASPLLEGDRLILNVGGAPRSAGIVAVDAQTGETLWTATDHKASYATPRAATIHGRRHMFVLTASGLVCLDPQSGDVRWSVVPFGVAPDDAMFVNAVSPLVHEDLVLASAFPSVGECNLCLRVLPDGTYQELWRDSRVMDSQYNNQVCVNGYVYGFGSMKHRGTLRCMHLETGKLTWEHRRTALRRGQLLAADGRLIALGEKGELALIDVDYRAAHERAITAQPVLEAPTYNAPALSNGLLYARNERQIVSLDLRAGHAERAPESE